MTTTINTNTTTHFVRTLRGIFRGDVTQVTWEGLTQVDAYRRRSHDHEGRLVNALMRHPNRLTLVTDAFTRAWVPVETVDDGAGSMYDRNLCRLNPALGDEYVWAYDTRPGRIADTQIENGTSQPHEGWAPKDETTIVAADTGPEVWTLKKFREWGFTCSSCGGNFPIYRKHVDSVGDQHVCDQCRIPFPFGMFRRLRKQTATWHDILVLNKLLGGYYTDQIARVEEIIAESLLKCYDSGMWHPEYLAVRGVGSLDGCYFCSLNPAMDSNVPAWTNTYQWCDDVNGDEGWEFRRRAMRTHDGGYITQDLYEEEFFACRDCGEIFHVDDRDSDYHNLCCGCGDVAREDDDDCDDDDNGNGPIRDYGTNIFRVLNWKADGKSRYFGIELEQEFPSDSRAWSAQRALNLVPGLARMSIWKHDGSLDDGAELVTLPLTLAEWRKEDNPLKELVNNSEWRRISRSHNTNTCGLHVHVTRSTASEPTWAKAVVLLNLPEMAETLALVGRRVMSSTYCHASKKRWHSDANSRFHSLVNNGAGKNEAALRAARSASAVCKKQFTQGSRYTPLNLTDDTGEFRLFRGTLRWETIIASIEFCDAVLSFCAQHGPGSITRHHFLKWLNKNVVRKTYPALREYLELRTVLPKGKERKIFAPEPPAPVDDRTPSPNVPAVMDLQTFVDRVQNVCGHAPSMTARYPGYQYDPVDRIGAYYAGGIAMALSPNGVPERLVDAALSGPRTALAWFQAADPYFDQRVLVEDTHDGVYEWPENAHHIIIFRALPATVREPECVFATDEVALAMSWDIQGYGVYSVIVLPRDVLTGSISMTERFAPNS